MRLCWPVHWPAGGSACGSVCSEPQRPAAHASLLAPRHGPLRASPPAFCPARPASQLSYASPILHHVLVTDLAPGSTLYYVVGEPTASWQAAHRYRLPARCERPAQQPSASRPCLSMPAGLPHPDA